MENGIIKSKNTNNSTADKIRMLRLKKKLFLLGLSEKDVNVRDDTPADVESIFRLYKPIGYSKKIFKKNGELTKWSEEKGLDALIEDLWLIYEKEGSSCGFNPDDVEISIMDIIRRGF